MNDVPCALVVDDAQSARHRVAVLLQLAGWRVYEVAGMQAAARAAAQLDPDLVVTDLRMRGGCGLGLVQQLRRSGSRGRFLILSTRPTARIRAQAAVSGAGLLAKPVDPRQLVDFLRRPPEDLAAPHRARPVRVAAQRLHAPTPEPAAASTSPDEDDEGPSWMDRQRSFFLEALPYHLAWIAESARAGDASAVADEARTLAGESGRTGHRDVARVCSTIADDAERGIVSQPKLMQLVMLASATRTRR
jgi:CheY-like chemotaxis protein